MGCGCAAGNGPISEIGGAGAAWRAKSRLGGLYPAGWTGTAEDKKAQYGYPLPKQPIPAVPMNAIGWTGTPDGSPARVLPAGQYFARGILPIYPYLNYSSPYPSELLSDCSRWGTLTLEQKYALVSQTVSPERVGLVVSDLNVICGAPYSYSVYPYAYNPYVFPLFYGSWSSGRFFDGGGFGGGHGGGGGGHGGGGGGHGGGGGGHHAAGAPIAPAG